MYIPMVCFAEYESEYDHGSPPRTVLIPGIVFNNLLRIHFHLVFSYQSKTLALSSRVIRISSFTGKGNSDENVYETRKNSNRYRFVVSSIDFLLRFSSSTIVSSFEIIISSIAGTVCGNIGTKLFLIFSL